MPFVARFQAFRALRFLFVNRVKRKESIAVFFLVGKIVPLADFDMATQGWYVFMKDAIVFSRLSESGYEYFL
jgi:hypothetical protein